MARTQALTPNKSDIENSDCKLVVESSKVPQPSQSVPEIQTDNKPNKNLEKIQTPQLVPNSEVSLSTSKVQLGKRREPSKPQPSQTSTAEHKDNKLSNLLSETKNRILQIAVRKLATPVSHVSNSDSQAKLMEKTEGSLLSQSLEFTKASQPENQSPQKAMRKSAPIPVMSNSDGSDSESGRQIIATKRRLLLHQSTESTKLNNTDSREPKNPPVQKAVRKSTLSNMFISNHLNSAWEVKRKRGRPLLSHRTKTPKVSHTRIDSKQAENRALVTAVRKSAPIPKMSYPNDSDSGSEVQLIAIKERSPLPQRTEANKPSYTHTADRKSAEDRSPQSAVKKSAPIPNTFNSQSKVNLHATKELSLSHPTESAKPNHTNNKQAETRPPQLAVRKSESIPNMTSFDSDMNLRSNNRGPSLSDRTESAKPNHTDNKQGESRTPQRAARKSAPIPNMSDSDDSDSEPGVKMTVKTQKTPVSQPSQSTKWIPNKNKRTKNQPPQRAVRKSAPIPKMSDYDDSDWEPKANDSETSQDSVSDIKPDPKIDCTIKHENLNDELAKLHQGCPICPPSKLPFFKPRGTHLFFLSRRTLKKILN